MERPYISLVPLHSKKRLLGYFYMVLTMFFSSSSTLVTSYLTSVIRVDSVHANTLCLWLLPGFVVGAFICFWWFRWQRWRFRYLIGGGMSCFAIYFGVLYFGVSPDSTYEMLYLPTFFRGLGMMTLIIPFSLYAVEKLDPKHLLSNAFFLISFRSVLAPVIGLSFFSNMLYRFQQQSLHVLSETVTSADPVSSARYGQSLAGALAQGHGPAEAVQVATSSLYTTLQQQSLLLSVKTLLGYLLLAAVLIAVVSCFIPFHRTVKVKIAKTGSDMV